MPKILNIFSHHKIAVEECAEVSQKELKQLYPHSAAENYITVVNIRHS